MTTKTKSKDVIRLRCASVILAPTSLLPPLVPLVPTHTAPPHLQPILHPAAHLETPTPKCFKRTRAQMSPMGKEKKFKWALYLVGMTRGPVPHVVLGQATEAARPCGLLFTSRLTSQETSTRIE